MQQSWRGLGQLWLRAVLASTFYTYEYNIGDLARHQATQVVLLSFIIVHRCSRKLHEIPALLLDICGRHSYVYVLLLELSEDIMLIYSFALEGIWLLS